MTMLWRYLLRQNLWLMGLCLALGAGIYLLVDLLDRLDELLDAGVGLWAACLYFGGKLPGILGQVLPAVLLVAVLVQLGQMRSSGELLALRAGGVPPWRLWRCLLLTALGWVVVQLLLSQVAGLAGQRLARDVWDAQVRGRVRQQVVQNVWFRDGPWLGRMGLAWPAEGRGEDLELFRLSADGRRLEAQVRAKAFRVEQGGLRLGNAVESVFQSGASPPGPPAPVGPLAPVRLDLRAYAAGDARLELNLLPAWRLLAMARQLRAQGSNVEAMETAGHARLAYAMSLPVMVLAALAISSLGRSMALGVGLGMLLAFGYYALFALGSAAGESGALPPVLAAWLANAVVAWAAGLRLWAASRSV